MYIHTEGHKKKSEIIQRRTNTLGHFYRRMNCPETSERLVSVAYSYYLKHLFHHRVLLLQRENKNNEIRFQGIKDKTKYKLLSYSSIS